MASETAEAESCLNDVSGLFDQAFRAYGDSLKVAMKTQEDAVKFWTDAMGKVHPPQVITGDWIPVAQKNADEYLRLLETSYRRNAELLKKVIHSQNGPDRIDWEKNARELWESSCEVARENMQDLATTNMRLAQLWTDAFKKGAQQKAAVGK